MFEWLKHAWTTYDSGVTDLLSDALLRGDKDDPRFIAFGQKIGIIRKRVRRNPERDVVGLKLSLLLLGVGRWALDVER